MGQRLSEMYLKGLEQKASRRLRAVFGAIFSPPQVSRNGSVIGQKTMTSFCKCSSLRWSLRTSYKMELVRWVRACEGAWLAKRKPK